MKRPVAISLFSGAGGLCLGFEQAGFDVPVAVEIDPIHAATHKLNFPEEWVTLNQSVQSTSAEDIRQHIGSRTIDVLIGGPPCQGFSQQGKRDANDPRSQLINDFVRLVGELRPKTFVLENVKGLTLTHCLPVLEKAIAQLEALGYSVPPWQVLNAKAYDVPQSRERLFVLGSRQDVPAVYYPEPTGTVTVAEALIDVPDAEDSCWGLGDGRVKNYGAIMPRTPYAEEMQCLQEEGWHQGHKRFWEFNYLYNCNTTNHSSAVRERFASTAPGTREGISRFHRLAADGVSPTLRAGTDSQRGRHTAPRPIHHRYARCITVREMARLSGFPDWFRFHDTIWHGARQIGNAVPPPLARAIAQEIYKSIVLSRS